MGIEKIQYNKEEYTQMISLMRLNPEKSDKQKDYLTLLNDNIRSFKFYNDLLTGTPKIAVLFEDVGNQEIPKYKPDGYAFIILQIVDTIADTKEEITMSLSFTLQSIKIVNQKTESTVYELTGNSFYESYLNAQMLYSSKGVKSTTKIVEEMLKNGKYPFEPDKKLTHATSKTFYISPVNSTLGDCIDNILSYTVSQETGLYYVMHHMLSDKAKIISLKDVYKQLKIGTYNYVLIPTKESFAPLEISLMDLDSQQFVGGNDFYDLTNNMTLNNFDYLNRQWSTDKYTFKRVDEISPNFKKQGYEKIYKEIPKLMSNKIRKTQEVMPIQYSKLREQVHKLSTFSDTIQFKTMGNLKRDVGELILIDCENDNLKNRFYCFWLIQRIYHKFEGGQYTNEIIAVRTDESPTIYRNV